MRLSAGMIRPALSLLSIGLLLSARSQPAPEEQQADSVPTADLEGRPGDPAPDPPPRPDGTHDETNDGFPNLDPPDLTPEAERSETGARSVLVTWARAIGLEEFDQAWGLLPDSAKERQRRTEFAALFDGLREITVAAPGGTIERAAGSTYYVAPLTITAQDSGGRPVRSEGEIVLRPANRVPGVPAEQLRWQIEDVDMDWAH